MIRVGITAIEYIQVDKSENGNYNNFTSSHGYALYCVNQTLLGCKFCQ